MYGVNWSICVIKHYLVRRAEIGNQGGDGEDEVGVVESATVGNPSYLSGTVDLSLLFSQIVSRSIVVDLLLHDKRWFMVI